MGHELKYDDQKMVGNYLRVGFDPDGSWRIYKLRPDFHPAEKVQVEDDITASVVVPRESLNDLDARYSNASVKLVTNCEALLFQRPDEAIHRGFDAQAEADLAAPGTFISNFEPLSVEQARAIVDHVVEFDQYTEPMKQLLERFVKGCGVSYVVSSAHPRMVDGKPVEESALPATAPRPGQRARDLPGRNQRAAGPRNSVRRPVHFPVNAVLAGRRGSPPDPKIGLPPLAVYSPIHYQELPELFMDFICSLTGKSPSTTGFGSEGALTKGPFNALWPVVDLNNALVSFILTGYAGFTTAAGYIGPHFRVDHDISMLVPELWCRMKPGERDPAFLIENGYLEKVDDFELNGRKVLASRLGYRITSLFADQFLGRLFETPDMVFTEEMLRPEKQDPAAFATGVDAIVESQRRVALELLRGRQRGGGLPAAEGAAAHHGARRLRGAWARSDPALRALFTREHLLASDWYRERLRVKQQRDVALWQRNIAALEAFRATPILAAAGRLDTDALLETARRELAHAGSAEYLGELTGTIGADPFHCQIPVAG